MRRVVLVRLPSDGPAATSVASAMGEVHLRARAATKERLPLLGRGAGAW